MLVVQAEASCVIGSSAHAALPLIVPRRWRGQRLRVPGVGAGVPRVASGRRRPAMRSIFGSRSGCHVGRPRWRSRAAVVTVLLAALLNTCPEVLRVHLALVYQSAHRPVQHAASNDRIGRELVADSATSFPAAGRSRRLKAWRPLSEDADAGGHSMGLCQCQ